MWYKVEDKLPEMTFSAYDWQESERLLVKTVGCAFHIAYYCGYVDRSPAWITNSGCSEGRDITNEVTHWTEIPE
jgi:hypothetical protein